MPGNLEVEAKFALLDRRTLDWLLVTASVGRFQVGEVGVQQVTDHYVDTADWAILSAGYACRIREADGQRRLSLKEAGLPSHLRPGGGRSKGLHRRQELEEPLPLPADPLALEDWPASPLKDLVAAAVAQRPLSLLFSLRQTRHVRLLQDGPRVIAEQSLDEVTIGDQASFTQLEVELRPEGTEQDLAHVIQALSDIWKLLPDPLTKFERGLAWLAGRAPRKAGLSADERQALIRLHQTGSRAQVRAAHAILLWDAGLEPRTIGLIVGLSRRRVSDRLRGFRKQRLAALAPAKKTAIRPGYDAFPSLLAEKHPPIRPDDPMSEAGRATLRFHFERMLAHEPGTRRGEDIEELHDMRVATRRMRAAFRVFGPYFSPKAIRPHLRGLRRTGRALGPVRDLDVFEENAQRYLRTLPAERTHELDALLAAWHQEREAARQQMLIYLDGPDYARFVRQCWAFLTTAGLGALPISPQEPVPYQVQHEAPRLIYTRFEQVRAYEPLLDSAPIELLHALRIDAKQLRYVLEFLVPVLEPEPALMAIEEVKALQDHLGNLNDAHVATQLLETFMLRWERAEAAPLPGQGESPAGLIAYLENRRTERDRLLATFPAAWQRFSRPEVRRNLALAVARL